jgi:hypothetical protein
VSIDAQAQLAMGRALGTTAGRSGRPIPAGLPMPVNRDGSQRIPAAELRGLGMSRFKSGKERSKKVGEQNVRDDNLGRINML